MILQWWSGEDWLTLNPFKYHTLDPNQKYRVYDGVKGINYSFSGNKWDASIMNDNVAFSYWLGLWGFLRKPPGLDNDAYYEGCMDRINGKKQNAE